MKFAKKYFLIDESRMSKIQSQNSSVGDGGGANTSAGLIHPNVKAVSDEKEEMNDILGDENLSDYEKVERHSQSIVKYLSNLKDALRVSKSQAILGKDPPPKMAKLLDDSVENKQNGKQREKQKTGTKVLRKMPMTQITNALPWGMRQRGKNLLRELTRSPGFSWDHEGMVRYKGDIFKETNITKLTEESLTKSSPDGRANKLVARLLNGHSSDKRGADQQQQRQQQQQKGNGIHGIKAGIRGRWIKRTI